jgi:hypothetical protein
VADGEQRRTGARSPVDHVKFEPAVPVQTLPTMTTTLTFGDVAENHVKMEQIGSRCAPGEGFSLLDLMRARVAFEAAGYPCEILTLNTTTGVLVIRGGLAAILERPDAADALKEEQDPLEKDKKVFMYGQVKNKKARWNLCFAEEGHEPCYEEGKGRVISYADVPLTAKLMASLPAWFGEKARDLKGEGNYYYAKTCGIGYHGDTERRKVIAVRLGESMSLHFQGYKYGVPAGPHHEILLNHGDVYMMSEKAVGTDWKCSSILTYRHAAGAASFTKI